MRTSPAGSLLAALAALSLALVPGAAAGHGVTAEVDQRGGAVAVRVRGHGDRPLAGARYEVRSPRGGAPFAEGRTDRHGWVAFTPDAPGTWEVRVADDGGHGKVVEVEVAEVEPVALAAHDPPAVVAPPHPGPLPPQGGGSGGMALRVLGSVAAIAAIFGALYAFQRSRRPRGR